MTRTFEEESADRLDVGRHVGDIVGGVPSAAGLRPSRRVTRDVIPRATMVPPAVTAWAAGVTITAGMPAARPAIPPGLGMAKPATTASPAPATISVGRATIRAALAARRPAWECGPAWASAASARGADRPQVPRSPRAWAPIGDLRVHSAVVGGGQRMGAAAGYRAAGGEATMPTAAAGRHSGGAPAALLQPSDHRRRDSPIPDTQPSSVAPDKRDSPIPDTQSSSVAADKWVSANHP